MEIFITVALVALVGIAVAYPLWRPPLIPLDDGVGPASQLAALEERKAAIYGAIRELGFDFRTDKLTEEDYRIESEVLKNDAVALVAEIEAMRTQIPRADPATEGRVEEARRRLAAASPAATTTAPGDAGAFCTSCGQPAAPEHRFCASCGSPLEPAS